MKSTFSYRLVIIFTLVISPFCNALFAQNEQQDFVNTISTKDSLFWISYNKCDVEGMQKFFTDDVEFYHDKGGATIGLSNLAEILKKNLCGNENSRLRREIVPGTVKIFLMKDAETTYGAIISGEHVFYVLEKDKQERLDGLAKFTHLWILHENTWKMSRILSYDHGPPRSQRVKNEIQL